MKYSDCLFWEVGECVLCMWGKEHMVFAWPKGWVGAEIVSLYSVIPLYTVIEFSEFFRKSPHFWLHFSASFTLKCSHVIKLWPVGYKWIWYTKFWSSIFKEEECSHCGSSSILLATWSVNAGLGPSGCEWRQHSPFTSRRCEQ